MVRATGSLSKAVNSCSRTASSTQLESMKRPTRIHRTRPVSSADAAALAREASYAGSCEHKVGPWWGGRGGVRIGTDGKVTRPKRQRTAICPLTSLRDGSRATEWLQKAISRHQFVFVEGDKRFPKHVWYVDSEGQGWAGRCINSVSGEYKGWPISVDEMNRMKNRGRR